LSFMVLRFMSNRCAVRDAPFWLAWSEFGPGKSDQTRR